MAKNKTDNRLTPNEQQLYYGINIIKKHQLFGSLSISMKIAEKNRLSKGTSAITYESGDVLLNRYENHTPQEWAYIIAHCMLHLCFGHFK